MAPATPTQISQAVQGLRFRTNQEMPDREDPKKKIRVPHERPMTPADVMDSVVTENVCTLVCKDGSKHRVELGGKPAPQDDGKKGDGK